MSVTGQSFSRKKITVFQRKYSDIKNMCSDIQNSFKQSSRRAILDCTCFKFTTQHSILFALKESKMISNQTIEKQTADTVVFSPVYFKGTC